MDMVFVPPTESRGAIGRRRVIRKLRKDGATSAGTARPFEPSNRLEERGLARALRCGMVRQTDKGGFWVDEEKVAACRTKEIRFVIIGLLAMLLLFAILYVLGEFN